MEGGPGSSPFTGRPAELTRLDGWLRRAQGGEGGTVILCGEPGIGKSRTAQECARMARAAGFEVLRGVCEELPAARAYGPFVALLNDLVRGLEAPALHAAVGSSLATLARVVPSLFELEAGAEEPTPLDPDREQFRLFETISALCTARSSQSPLLIVLDDLHWADPASVELFKHLVGSLSASRVLLLGTYRNNELEGNQPLGDAVALLRRREAFDVITLEGLPAPEAAEFVRALLSREPPDKFADLIASESKGNPFFARELVLHLVETGAIVERGDGWMWTSPPGELALPETVRDVIERRVRRLSAPAQELLTIGSAFEGGFRLAVASRVAGLDEQLALDAVDEATNAKLLAAGADDETLDFAHALVRHTLYARLNPPRRARIHRLIAEVYTSVYGEGAVRHAAQIAHQYRRSAALPGAERGCDSAIIASDQARASYDWDRSIAFLRLALDLLSSVDERRTPILARLGRMYAAMFDEERASAAAEEASELMLASDGAEAAADYLAEITQALERFGSLRAAGLASRGLRLIGSRRDNTWAILASVDLSRREDDADDLPTTQERWELSEVVRRLPPVQRGMLSHVIVWRSRDEILADSEADSFALSCIAGEYRRGLKRWRESANHAERTRRPGEIVRSLALAAECLVALGDLAEAEALLERATSYAAAAPRLTSMIHLVNARYILMLARGDPWERLLIEPAPPGPKPDSVLVGAIVMCGAQAHADFGRVDPSLAMLKRAIPALERAQPGGDFCTMLACSAAETLWLLNRLDYIDVVEQNLREKVLGPDFRYPMRDGRRSLGHLAALRGEYDEAARLFAQARVVLEEQGARPLRAIVDYDECLMILRQGASGDRERAAVLLDAAMGQFGTLGMMGWIDRSEALRSQHFGREAARRVVYRDRLTHREIEVLRLIAAGRTNREIAADLVLSQRTVARHIANIYDKIDARSKSEATAYAFRHELA